MLFYLFSVITTFWGVSWPNRYQSALNESGNVGNTDLIDALPHVSHHGVGHIAHREKMGSFVL